MEELADGERLEIVATDAGFPRDAEAWCQTTGNRFVSVKSGAGRGNSISFSRIFTVFRMINF